MWSYFAATGWRDAWRARASLLMNVFIVAGIGLPIVLLLGLERGLVERFRANLNKSPTARLIQATATIGPRFGREREAELEAWPGIGLVIPEITTTAAIEAAGPPAKSIRVTIAATKPGDPLLGFYGVDALASKERAIVLSIATARELGIPFESTGPNRTRVTGRPKVNVRVVRAGESTGDDLNVAGGHAVEVEVKAVYDATGTTAYLDRDLMDLIQDYKYGRSVAELGWPGSTNSPKPYYDGYLAFIKKPYDRSDLDRLKGRGLEALPIATDAAGPRGAWRTVLGLLRPHGHAVYYVRSGRAEAKGGEPVDLEPADVEEITTADDIMFPWVEPSTRKLDGKDHQLVGVTVNARWLRRDFRDDSTRLTADPTELRTIRPAQGQAATVALDLGDGPTIALQGLAPRRPLLAGLPTAGPSPVVTATLQLLAADNQPPPGPPVAVVPAVLAAHLAERDRGHLVFDGITNRFAAAPTENLYTEARIYAEDLDVVPEVDEALRATGPYNTVSSKTRVLEMRGYADTLDVLIRVVMMAVLIFGTLTILFVFGDVTGRKRGAIGIMRVMGMPPVGIFCIVLVRALVVGLAGGCICLLFGAGLAWVATQLFGADCRLVPEDLFTVFVAALGCCVAGVLYPAFRAASIDPIDAILQARTQ